MHSRTKFHSMWIELPPGIPVLSGHFGRETYRQLTRPLHLLHDDWDLLYIAGSDTTWKLKNGEIVTVPKDFFWLKPPYVPITLQPPVETFSHWFCHFDFHPVSNRVFPGVQSDCLLREKKTFCPMLFSRRQAPRVWRAYHDLLTISHGPEGKPWRFAGALIRLVSEVAAFALRFEGLKKHGPVVGFQMMQDPRISDLCARIRAAPALPWKGFELARKAGLSVGHLNHLFRAGMGKGLKSFVIECRLKRALKLLIWSEGTSYRSMKEISVECGFSSQQFFSRQFKDFYGMTPTQYRLRKRYM